jgi:hypothetical protein
MEVVCICTYGTNGSNLFLSFHLYSSRFTSEGNYATTFPGSCRPALLIEIKTNSTQLELVLAIIRFRLQIHAKCQKKVRNNMMIYYF